MRAGPSEPLDEAAALLERLGIGIGEDPPRQAHDVAFEPRAHEALVAAARGVRWVRGVTDDALRWGAVMGRLRWLAAKHPEVRRGRLPSLLAENHRPGADGSGPFPNCEERRHDLRPGPSRTGPRPARAPSSES